MACKIGTRALDKIDIRCPLGSLTVPRQASTETDWTWQAITVCERLAAIALLLMALPLLGLCAIVLWLRSGRPPLIAHRRVGWRGVPLRMMKLRTMWGEEARRGGGWIEQIDDDHGPERKTADD